MNGQLNFPNIIWILSFFRQYMRFVTSVRTLKTVCTTTRATALNPIASTRISTPVDIMIRSMLTTRWNTKFS